MQVPKRHPGPHAFADRLDQSETLEQPDDGRRSPPGTNQRVDGSEILRRAHLARAGSGAPQRAEMLDDVTCSARTPTVGAATVSCRG